MIESVINDAVNGLAEDLRSQVRIKGFSLTVDRLRIHYFVGLDLDLLSLARKVKREKK